MQAKVKRVYLPRIKVYLSALAILILVMLAVKFYAWGRQLEQATGLTPRILFNLLVDSGSNLKTTDGRTNLLVLGIAGGSHAGADLTDTILVLSLDSLKKKLTMISLPRDIWSDTLKDKINSAYHYGEAKQPLGGILLSRVIVEDMIGLPIHYVLLVDFSGFKEVIDLVGGVAVDVPQGFTDPQFPIAGKEGDECDGDPEYKCRYEVLEFKAGKQLMDGERALKYVRSRHAEGEEGSDFARSRRQQEVLLALKDRLVSFGQWASLARIRGLISALDQMTETDIRLGELLTITKVMSGIPSGQIKRISLEPLLEAPPLWVYGRYVLVPKEDYASIHSFLYSQLDL